MRDLTQLATKLWWAFAYKAVQHHVALAAVLARSALTFISLEFAVIPNKPRRTLAVVTPWPLLTGSPVFAQTLAAVDVYLAGLSFPLWGAPTLEAFIQVDTGPTVSTWTGRTVIQILFTSRALPAWRTPTFIACSKLMACPTIRAGVGNTGVLGYLTVPSGEALWTGTVIQVWFRVHAGSSVDARLVTAAVIEVFLTIKATPVLLTVTLPGLVAGAMDASGKDLTFVTKMAFPAIVTLAFAWSRAVGV